MFNNKEYYIKNREKLLEKSKQRYKDDSKKAKEYSKQWKKNNLGKVREYKRKYRENNREKINEYNKKRYEYVDRIRYQRRRKYIQDYKLSKGCSICSYNKCAAALDFHHNGNKDFRIAMSIGLHKSLKEIKEEIDKCVVLCSNCHRELHAKEN